MEKLSSTDVFKIHEKVINPDELQGAAGNKSLEAVIARVENRILYGLIKDECDLAAAYAVVIAVGHVFNDANKRTAYRAMMACLEANDIEVDFDNEEIGQVIIKVAQGLIDEVGLADYLRSCRVMR